VPVHELPSLLSHGMILAVMFTLDAGMTVDSNAGPGEFMLVLRSCRS
jgi:hypothetical protein